MMINKATLNKIILSILFLLSLTFRITAQQNYYLEAYSVINSMLESNSCNFKDAVYQTENAYFEGQIDKKAIDDIIRFYSFLCKQIIQSGNIIYAENDKDIANTQCAVFLFMTDSIPIEINGEIMIHTPFQYNTHDFTGKKDWSNTFVTTLIDSKTGNCHSLPYLYKMIMDELGQEAFLALAPNHIYIKVNNKKVGWYNIELTCGDFPADAWLMASGYIHLDAIRNGIYMNPLNDKQSVAMCLVDLAQGYQAKFGLGDGTFILKCCDTALNHFPDYINALLLKAETITALYKQTEDEEKKNILFGQMNELYPYIHDLGYRKMPHGMYENWLKSLNAEKTNQKVKSIMVKSDNQ